MKFTGRIVLVLIAVAFSVQHSIVFNGGFISQESLIAITVALLVGWQYDALQIYIKKTKESEESYKNLVESLPESVTIHYNNKILYINEATVKMLAGSSKDEIIGKSILDFVVSEYQERTLERLRIVNKNKKPLMNIEHKLQRLDGKIIVYEVTSMLIVFGGKDCILSIGKDITDRKEETERLLLKSEKLALLGQMAAGIAHEIRNPLTSIMGFIQLFKANNEEKGYYDIVLSELERINMIVGEFLFLAKPSTVVLKEKNLIPLLNDVITLINTQSIMNNVEIYTEFEDEIPNITCEENQLKQVFINLLKNSIEAMPNGGIIVVGLKRSENGMITIQISDEGMGIPAERMSTLGEPFYTTKEKGTGLGLMTCFKIIESHNGKIHINSEVGKGTEIEILLPTITQALIKKEV